MQQPRCPYCGHAMRPPSKKIGAVLSRPVRSHDWSTRVVNTFENAVRWNGTANTAAPIRTFADLCARSAFELLLEPNFGRVSLAEVEEVLAGLGLQLTTVQGWGDNEIRSNPCLEGVRPEQGSG